MDIDSKIVENFNKFKEDSHKIPKSLIGSLFFSARNGGIERTLRSIESHFKKLGFDVDADWRESSFGRTSTIKLTLNTKTLPHERSIDVSRDSVGPSVDGISNLVYFLKSIHAGAYYRSKKPAIAVKFDEALSAPSFKEMVEKLIKFSVNPPFDYNHHSGF